MPPLFAPPRLEAIGKIEEEDVYVWWGKVKSSNRQQPMSHLRDIMAMDADLSSEGGARREVHLYLRRGGRRNSVPRQRTAASEGRAF